MHSATSVVHSDPDILGGTPVFVGTRVPVRTLLDYLAAGDSLDEFLDHFPTVSREQAVAALEQANDLLDDTLMDELLASNPKFQALVAKSKASRRKAFSLEQQAQTNG